jgi:hypothetical protein
MLAGRLISLIESRWEAITTNALRQIRREPGMTHIASLPGAELREWGQDILQHLGYWLTQKDMGELADRYEALGRLRFEEGVPLYEKVRGIAILKDKIIEFIEQQAVDGSSSEIHAEKDLSVRLGRFFDFLICHLVAGYEKALRQAANLEAAIHPPPRRRATG